VSVGTDTTLGLAWSIEGGPFYISSFTTLGLDWSIEGRPLPSTILVKINGELAQVPSLVKAGGELIDPSTFEPWP
jgi:hypothetical protein